MSAKRKPKTSSPSPVSMGNTATENLPFPIVHYPGLYGAFFASAEKPNGPSYLCSCSERAIKNYLRLRSTMERFQNYHHSDPLMNVPLNNQLFPTSIAQLSAQSKDDPLSILEFRSELCHRCNLASPTLRYCHEMYGVRFIQYYGWYVQQMYLHLGIYPMSFEYLSDVCPEEFQQDITTLLSARTRYREELTRLYEVVSGLSREDIAPDEITYWRNVTFDDAADMIKLRRQSAKTERKFTTKIENIVRQEFGFKQVGEGWVSEKILYQIVRRIFNNDDVLHHSYPDWLEGLELDIHIPCRQLAFEYQGQQHFHPIKAWGGQKALDELQLRDKRKAKLCLENGIILISFDYTEPLTEEHVRYLLSQNKVCI